MSDKTKPCPECRGEIDIVADSGGRHESTEYRAQCRSCGLCQEHLPSNCSGRRRDAVREWNTIVERAKRTGGDHD